MAKNDNVSVNFSYLKGEATKCKNTCLTKIKKYNDELDDLVVKELQPYWKSRKANKLYKKFKGHINNNYKWLESISDLNNEIIRVAKAIENQN